MTENEKFGIDLDYLTFEYSYLQDFTITPPLKKRFKWILPSSARWISKQRAHGSIMGFQTRIFHTFCDSSTDEDDKMKEEKK